MANQQLQLAHQKGLRAPHERGGHLLRERATQAHDVRGAEAVQLQRGRQPLLLFLCRIVVTWE